MKSNVTDNVTDNVIDKVTDKVADKVVDKVVEKVAEKLTDNQKSIIEIIKRNPFVSARELAPRVGIYHRKIQENLASNVASGGRFLTLANMFFYPKLTMKPPHLLKMQ